MVIRILRNLRTKIGSKSYPYSDLERRNLLKGIGLIVFCFLTLALNNSFAKTLSVRIHPFETVFLQSAFAVILLLPYALKEGLRGLVPRYISLHLLRDVSGGMAFACSFYAAMSIPIVDVMLLYSASALWLPLILLIVLKQKMPAKLVICILLGFAGVMVILKPTSALFSVGSIFGVFSGLLMAIAMVSLRFLAQKEPRHRVVFNVCFVSMLLGALSLPFVWVTPHSYELLLISINGACMALTQLLLTKAYTIAPASRLTPFSYTVVLSAGLIDWLLWNTLPTPLSVMGAILVVGAAIASLSLKTDRQLT
jgi:drug/metabolite transporter (DMT)-like permease